MTATTHHLTLPAKGSPTTALRCLRLAAVATPVLWVAQAGCLFRPAPVAARYFRPAHTMIAETDALTVAPGQTGGRCHDHALRLHHVRAGDLLKERIVWRRSDVELGLHEQLRWAELPSHYVRVALEQELYVRQGFLRRGGTASTELEVELTAFEEVRVAPQGARVGLALTTNGTAGARLQLDETAPFPADADSAAAVARAMGAALQQAARRAGEQLARTLCAAAAAPSP